MKDLKPDLLFTESAVEGFFKSCHFPNMGLQNIQKAYQWTDTIDSQTLIAPLCGIYPHIGLETNLFTTKNFINTIKPTESRFYGILQDNDDNSTMMAKNNLMLDVRKRVDFLLEITRRDLSNSQESKIYLMVTSGEKKLIELWIGKRKSHNPIQHSTLQVQYHITIRNRYGVKVSSTNEREGDSLNSSIMQIRLWDGEDPPPAGEYTELALRWLKAGSPTERKERKELLQRCWQSRQSIEDQNLFSLTRLFQLFLQADRETHNINKRPGDDQEGNEAKRHKLLGPH